MLKHCFINIDFMFCVPVIYVTMKKKTVTKSSTKSNKDIAIFVKIAKSIHSPIKIKNKNLQDTFKHNFYHLAQLEMNLYRVKLYVALHDAFNFKTSCYTIVRYVSPLETHGYILIANMSKYSFQMDKNTFYVTVSIASFTQSQF